MNFKLTAILLGFVLLLVSGLLLVVLTDDKPPTGGLILAPLAGMKPSDIQVVELSRSEPAEKLVFARTGPETWELREGNAGKLDLGAVNRTIEALLKLKAVDSPERTSDPAKHGLDKPGLSVTLKSDKNAATIHVGDTTVGGDRALTFVASSERPSVPLAVKRADIAPLFSDAAKDGPANRLARVVSDYRLKRLLGVNLMDIASNAKAITVTTGGKTLTLSRGKGTEWKFDAPAGYGLADFAGDPGPSDAITGVRPLANAFTTFSAIAPEDFIEKPGPLADYGLDAASKKLLRVEIVPENGPPDVLLIGKKVDGSAPLKNYAMVPGEPVVVKILGDRAAALAKTVADPKVMQDRTLLKESDVPRIDAVSTNAGGSQADLRRVPVGSQARWVVYGGSEPHFAGTAVAALVQALTQPKVALEVLATRADAMFAPAEVKGEVKLWFDGNEKSESKDGGIPPLPKLTGEPSLTLLFGKVEGEKAWLRRTLAGGVTNDYLVPSSLATLAAKKRGEYFELKFKEFPTNLAKSVSFNRGGENFDIERDPKSDPDFPTGKWTFLQPASLKGQVADAETVLHLVGNLATLSAASVASEQPNDTELAIMGLAPPRLKVTVKLDDAVKERVYAFGNETPDKAHVYFKDPAKTTTYTVPRVTIDGYLNGDLRDRTPYRFDTKDVKSIRLKGWKNQSVHELTIVRNGDGWTVQGSPNGPANPITMMNLLNHFRAPKPIAVVGAEAPEQGFDAAKGGDPLEVTFIGDKGPLVVVTLGNETDGGGSLYAWNSIAKNVMKLPSGIYRPFKENPNAFRK